MTSLRNDKPTELSSPSHMTRTQSLGLLTASPLKLNEAKIMGQSNNEEETSLFVTSAYRHPGPRDVLFVGKPRNVIIQVRDWVKGFSPRRDPVRSGRSKHKKLNWSLLVDQRRRIDWRGRMQIWLGPTSVSERHAFRMLRSGMQAMAFKTEIRNIRLADQVLMLSLAWTWWRLHLPKSSCRRRT
jgi:hypothetical protein